MKQNNDDSYKLQNWQKNDKQGTTEIRNNKHVKTEREKKNFM